MPLSNHILHFFFHEKGGKRAHGARTAANAAWNDENAHNNREMKVLRVLPFLLTAAILTAALLFPVPEAETGEAEPRIVHIWNVDTFEGGKGSRSAFLTRVARQCERRAEGVFFRVQSLTKASAEAEMQQGNFPDLLSFGIGLTVDKARCIPFSAASFGVRSAVPWCRGAYYLFSMTEDFSEEDLVISDGGENLACAAAYFAGIAGEEKESLTAYLDFLGGKYRYLLGTQRDVCRFAARGTQVFIRSLPDYCDLYQYICMFSGEMQTECLRFLAVLFSPGVKDALSEIGMLPADGAQGRTVSPFATPAQLELAAQAVRPGSAEKNPVKFFESV